LAVWGGFLRELQKQLQEREELRLAVEQSFSSLAQEVDVKTKKLQKLWTKLQVHVCWLGTLSLRQSPDRRLSSAAAGGQAGD
jgi:hypothetical protein